MTTPRNPIADTSPAAAAVPRAPKQAAMTRFQASLVLSACLCCSGHAEAAFLDRGNGLIFDDVNNISWLVNAGASPDGTQVDHKSWADGLSLAGFDDFRLADINELANLYDQLPGPFGSDKTGNIPPFQNIQPVYWSGTELPGGDAMGIVFLTGHQFSSDADGLRRAGWAVRAGDSVSPIPEPKSVVLMGMGVVGLLAARRLRGK